MKNARNPISIESKQKGSNAGTARKAGKTGKSAGTATRHSAKSRSGSPASEKKAGQAKSSTRSKASGSSARTKAQDAGRESVSRSKETAANSAATTQRLPENRHPGLHDRSYAAHLDAGPRTPHTKPAGDLRFTAPFPTGRKQP